MRRARCVTALAFMLALGACNGPELGPPLPGVELGPALDATRADPVFLTFAAARARSRYLVDQGYTLTWDEEGLPAFHTQNAGDLGVVLEVDGILYATESDFATPVTVAHTASDAAVIRYDVDDELSVELWFYVGTSAAATLDVRLVSTAPNERQVSVFPYLRRCDDPFTAVAGRPRGVGARRSVTPDPLLSAAGPGTFVTELVDALATEEEPAATLGAAACGASAADDLGLLVNRLPEAPSAAALVALRIDRTIPPASSAEIRVHRAVADAAAPSALDEALAEEQRLDARAVLRDGKARLDAAPAIEGLSPADALLYRSSLALVDQATMPKEGNLGHDYDVFSREPLWWSARLGESVPESLAMILLARLDPREAVETYRNFIDRIEPDGYLPYSIGPVVDQTQGRTAAAPLFSFGAWEIAKVAQDDAFLADAYAAGKKLHAFWVEQRDVDQDGLAEWGGVAITESLRDPPDVIWEVAPPHEVEAVDLNSMLVMEERSLGAMASQLGKTDESAAWQGAADARAARMNAVMWDDATGFYYPVARDTDSFTYAKPGDLKRMGIAGFLPLWAGIVPADRRAALLAKLKDPALFLRAQGVASLSAQDPSYDPRASSCCRWNGPVRVPWQWLVVRGLRDAGEHALADEIVGRTKGAVIAELSRSHQFRELYDADDGARPNQSMPNDVWSAMAALMMLETP